MAAFDTDGALVHDISAQADTWQMATGVREKDGTVQMGLTQSEIRDVWRQLTRLLKDVDAGKIKTF